MASWFKAAEDLFEVVDRRAKLVVSELADEQSDNQSPPASNGQGSQGKKTNSRAKAQNRLSANEDELPIISDIVQEQTGTQMSQTDAISDKDGDAPSLETDGTTSSNSMAQTNNERKDSVDKEISVMGVPLAEILPDDVGVPDAFTVADIVTSNSNGELVKENGFDAHEDHPPLPLLATEVNVDSGDHLAEAAVAAHNIWERHGNDPLDIDQEKSHSLSDDASTNNDTQSKHSDLNIEPLSEENKHQEHKAITSAKKVQEQLDEAQGLLKSTKTTGQSKEARLARVCAGLSSRLQEYKSENSQLEEILTAERELTKSYEARIKHMQQDLSVYKMEVARVESNMAEVLAAKNSEIEALVRSVDALKKQMALSEGNLASLQANMESVMRNRELTETRMMQALREELATVERRAEEEHAAHNATKMAAMDREVELERRAVDASTSLARIQRVADERTSKSAELEQKVALLEVECASLNQELQDMEARTRFGQKKSPEEATQVIQMQAWLEEAERAHQGQRDAESKLFSLEAGVQKMRVEMAAMKRDAQHYSRQEHMELEKRYRELTDLLYYKQTQLESMASEKAAAEFQLEKEIKCGQDTQVEAERIRASPRTSSSWEEDTDWKALEPLPLHHRHMVGASVQLQKAAKILDTGAVRATRFLWRYPTARVILLFYLVFVHLFLMYLLHRLQEQAENLSSREIAESMGLSMPTLP